MNIIMKTKVLILAVVLALVAVAGSASAKVGPKNSVVANDATIQQLQAQIKALQEQQRARVKELVGTSTKQWKYGTSTASSTQPGWRKGVIKKTVKIKCAPGKMVAKGWVKKNGKLVRADVCKPLPRGIQLKLHATTTPAVVSTSTATTTASST